MEKHWATHAALHRAERWPSAQKRPGAAGDETDEETLDPDVADLSCLFSWAARSSSWMFLVICSVLRMTSSVLGSAGSDSISRSSSSGMELPSPSQPLLLSLPLRHKLPAKKKELNCLSCYFFLHSFIDI